MAAEGMFELDVDGGEPERAESEPSTTDIDTVDATPSGSITPFPPARAKSDISLCRKAVQVEEVEPDCCAICLDNYTDEDPRVPCTCGHGYHLACCMEWAKRSRECPFCFKQLELEDPSLNELLPFGEYIPPQQAAASAGALESWDLERLLVQLAAANQRHERRAARRARRGAAADAAGEASAPQAIRGPHGDGSTPSSARRHSSEVGAASSVVESSMQQQMGGAGPTGFPASWPPAGSHPLAAAAAASSDEGPSGSGGRRQNGHLISPGLKAASQSIKSRFAALKIRESFTKTTKEIKAMFSPSHRSDRPPAAGS